MYALCFVTPCPLCCAIIYHPHHRAQQEFPARSCSLSLLSLSFHIYSLYLGNDKRCVRSGEWPMLGYSAGSCAAQGPALGGGAKNRKGQTLQLNMRLLLAKDHLSTLDHQGSDQPAGRPKMGDRKSNQPKKKLNGYPAVTLRRFCAGSCAGCRVLRTLHPAEHPRADECGAGGLAALSAATHLVLLSSPVCCRAEAAKYKTKHMHT
eukprot:scaffold16724_cov127-Isochrysis_galbana.AAC.2